MDGVLLLYLVAPKGFEQLASVVVATSRDDAIEKANMRVDVKELTDLGTELMVVNITTNMAVQGYNIDVSKTGMFH